MSAQSTDDVMALVYKGAALLYDRGARRVWMFGSLALGKSQDERSDIDLVVEGLPPHQFSRTESDLNQLAGRKVDLVDLATAAPRLRPHILRTRVLLPQQDCPIGATVQTHIGIYE
jgi:predicted nucleotidyltransferase